MVWVKLFYLLASGMSFVKLSRKYPAKPQHGSRHVKSRRKKPEWDVSVAKTLVTLVLVIFCEWKKLGVKQGSRIFHPRFLFIGFGE